MSQLHNIEITRNGTECDSVKIDGYDLHGVIEVSYTKLNDDSPYAEITLKLITDDFNIKTV